MEKLISVIVPVYNVEKYIHRCVDSILAQTYTNLEIILVDDGSPDNCPAICDEYAKKDSRIKVIHKENSGLSSARNAGLDIATGDYIGFIDSDDYIASDMYKKLYKSIIENDSDMAICNYEFVNEQGKSLNNNMPVPNGVYSAKEALAFLQIDNYGAFVSACNRLFSKNLFDNFRFPIGKLNEDNFTAYQLIYRCGNIVMLSEPLYSYLQHSDSIMHQKITIRRFDELQALIEKKIFYEQNGFDSYIKPSELQILYIYRQLRVQIKNVNQEEKFLLDEYDSLAKSIYKDNLKTCSWKDHLFFKCYPLYKLILSLKEKLIK